MAHRYLPICHRRPLFARIRPGELLNTPTDRYMKGERALDHSVPAYVTLDVYVQSLSFIIQRLCHLCRMCTIVGTCIGSQNPCSYGSTRDFSFNDIRTGPSLLHGTPPCSMGLIQQVFNIGNFTAPVLLGGISTLTGRRNSTWWITFGFPLIGLILVID